MFVPDQYQLEWITSGTVLVIRAVYNGKQIQVEGNESLLENRQFDFQRAVCSSELFDDPSFSWCKEEGYADSLPMIQLDVPEKKQKRVTQKKLEDFVLFRMSATQSKIEETVKKERI